MGFFCLLPGQAGPAGQGGAPTAQAAVSGRILFAHLGEVWLAHAGGVSPVTQGGKYWSQPDWSPDGSRIAAVGWNPNSTDIFVFEADGSEITQLTRSQQRRLQDSDWVFFPRWSPDSQFIAYLSDRATLYPMLWIMRPDGSGQRQLTQVRRGMDAADTFTWSPDGTRIAVTGFSGAISQIHVIELARPTTSRVITNEPGGAFDPAWSPDGSTIAYAAREGRNTVIRLIDAAGTGPASTLIQADWARSPRWSPNGAALAYVAVAGSDFELFVVDITLDREGRIGTRRPAQITSRFGVEATSGLSWGQ